MVSLLMSSRRSKATSISGTSAAFIDFALIVSFIMVFAVAALKMHAPQRVDVQISIPSAPTSAEADDPLATVEITQEGDLVLDGTVIAADGIADALQAYVGVDGVFGLCVPEGVPYHLVRNVIAEVQQVTGPRQWADCGGALQ